VRHGSAVAAAGAQGGFVSCLQAIEQLAGLMGSIRAGPQPGSPRTTPVSQSRVITETVPSFKFAFLNSLTRLAPTFKLQTPPCIFSVLVHVRVLPRLALQ